MSGKMSHYFIEGRYDAIRCDAIRDNGTPRVVLLVNLGCYIETQTAQDVSP